MYTLCSSGAHARQGPKRGDTMSEPEERVDATVAFDDSDVSIDTLIHGRNTELQVRDVFARAFEFKLPEAAKAAQAYPFYQPLENNDGPEASIYGKRVLMLGSNNYLGLTRHPKVMEAAVAAIQRFGTSMTGSRVLNGTMDLHEQLEARIAKFLGKEAALVFTTGYQANLGAISALVGRGCVAVVDKSDHASIYDGCSLSGGKMVRFRHNDAAHLESVLANTSDEAAIVIVDGVYSMTGALVDLPGIVAACRKHNARLLVDDAHAIGVIGEGGRGAGSHFGLEDAVDLTVGTFSKSLASIGGFVAGQHAVVDWVRHFARPMVFSASLPPASTAAALAALDVLESEPEMVTRVRALGSRLRTGLRALGFDVAESESLVVPLGVGDEVETVRFWRSLLDRGIYTNPVVYPAATKGKAMLRTSCMATHTPDQIDGALEQFKIVGKAYGLI